MAKIEINNEHNGIEITFDGKPAEETRAALKENGFRWHRAKKIWYAKNTSERLELAQNLLEGAEIVPGTAEKTVTCEKLTPEKIEELKANYGTHKTGEGRYEGWAGNNEPGAACSDQELKRMILDEFKKCGIKATARTGRGGYTTSFSFTIRVPEECYVCREEYIESCMSQLTHTITWYRDPETNKEIFWEALYDMDEETQEKIRRFTYGQNYDNAVKWGYDDIATDDFKSLVKSIVRSFSHDNSDSMTDYYDVGIYADYTWKAA